MAVGTAPREAGDDTDPTMSEDISTDRPPLYPAEDRHETAKPNSQNIPLLDSFRFIHFSCVRSRGDVSSRPVHIHNRKSHIISCAHDHGLHLEK